MRARGELIPRRHPCTMTRKNDQRAHPHHHLFTSIYDFFYTLVRHYPPDSLIPLRSHWTTLAPLAGFRTGMYVLFLVTEPLVTQLYCGLGGGGLGWWVGSENVPVYMHTDTYTHTVDLFLHLHRHTHTLDATSQHLLLHVHTHTHWMLRHRIFFCTCPHWMLRHRIFSCTCTHWMLRRKINLL